MPMLVVLEVSRTVLNLVGPRNSGNLIPAKLRTSDARLRLGAAFRRFLNACSTAHSRLVARDRSS